MKRSKIFLGATTCLLAVAAIAATKANRFTSRVKGFFGTRGGTLATCNHKSIVGWFTQPASGSLQATTVYNAGTYPLYTSNAVFSGHCNGHALEVTPASGD